MTDIANGAYWLRSESLGSREWEFAEVDYVTLVKGRFKAAHPFGWDGPILLTDLHNPEWRAIERPAE